jgi:hypothetical protein
MNYTPSNRTWVNLMHKRRSPWFLKGVAIQFLSKHGNNFDLDMTQG